MAEASTVAETPNNGSVAQPRFFCHRCSVEIPRVLPGFKCPRCNSGFIEEMELQPEPTPQQSFSDDDSSDDADMEVVTSIGELLSHLRDTTAAAADMGGAAVGSSESGEANPTRRRRQATGTFMPVRSTRRRTNSDRQMAPLENIIQEFIINLSGFDFDPATMQAQGTPMFMYGNPGDYAFGRAGLDAIITQLLNQMDGTGPPPMAKDRIAEIPIVKVAQAQVDASLQCSVCWEDFKLDEPVRKLVCDHFYHTDCIVPWLQLHGTCPICRKSLNDETNSGNQNNSSNGAAAGPSASTSNSSNSSSSGQSWLASATQSGPRLISSFIGSLTNALSGGGSSSTPASSAASSSSSSSASQQQQQPNHGDSGSNSDSRRHQYNLRSQRDRPDGEEDDDPSSSNGSSRGRGRGRGHYYSFEDDYD